MAKVQYLKNYYFILNFKNVFLMFDNLNKHTLLNKNFNTFIRKSIIKKNKYI